MNVYLIAAVGVDGAIGQNGGLPWGLLTGDLRWFQRITMAADPVATARGLIDRCVCGVRGTDTNVVAMGRRTLVSVRARLPWRRIMLLHGMGTPHTSGEIPCRHTAHTVMQAAERANAPNLFFIGGTRVFAAALRLKRLSALFLTQVDKTFPQADTWFPADSLPDTGWTMTTSGPWEREHGLKYRLTIWERGHA